MKRFYKLVSTHKSANGWEIHLDGRSVKTPGKAVLLAASENLANEIVKEWAAQDKTIEPESMPITQIISTQIDRVSTMRPDMTAQLLKFLDTDLLCYRAEPDHLDTDKKQAEIWDEWLDWFEKRYGTKLQTTSSLAALTHPQEAHIAVEKDIAGLCNTRFAVLQLAVPASGSLILGLAFTHGDITPEQIMKAIRVEEHIKDEIYNAEFYGRDPMFEKKDAVLLRDLNAAETILKYS